MKVANNPQTFLNSYLSAFRNTIISLTLGIGIFSFSKTFENKKAEFMMRSMSIILYLFSLSIGINTSLMLHSYLKKMESLPEEEKKELPEYMDFKFWKGYLIMGIVFCVLISILILIAVERYVRKLL